MLVIIMLCCCVARLICDCWTDRKALQNLAARLRDKPKEIANWDPRDIVKRRRAFKGTRAPLGPHWRLGRDD